MKNEKLNKEEILWKVNYKILNVYLDFYSFHYFEWMDDDEGR